MILKNSGSLHCAQPWASDHVTVFPAHHAVLPTIRKKNTDASVMSGLERPRSIIRNFSGKMAKNSVISDVEERCP